MMDCKYIQAPGYGLIVIKDGVPIYKKGYGYSDVENNVQTTLDTLFPLGSCSKASTVFILGTLIENGKIDIGDEISKYAPGWFNKIDSYDATIEDALLMRIGLLNNDWVWALNISNTDIWDIVGNWKEKFQPQTKLRYIWNYFNFGYSLVGGIIQKILDQPWQDIVQSNFFKPMGMDQSFVYHRAALEKNPEDYAFVASC
eukprot:TRINITY_DN9459_c0_g1_i2.p1 TRINITY_DN9459_c0_g1~~TRINITY_DN9459_c0_g1_i2.p1  ORF type:complete len:200 (-),score=45.79 TRINITY_DN9459_c0_g1_i2:279-878(-)